MMPKATAPLILPLLKPRPPLPATCRPANHLAISMALRPATIVCFHRSENLKSPPSSLYSSASTELLLADRGNNLERIWPGSGSENSRLEVSSPQISRIPLFGYQASFFNRFTWHASLNARAPQTAAQSYQKAAETTKRVVTKYRLTAGVAQLIITPATIKQTDFHSWPSCVLSNSIIISSPECWAGPVSHCVLDK